MAVLSGTALCLPCLATDWGVLPYPRNPLAGKPSDLVEAIEKVQAISAPVNVTLLGWHDLEPGKETYDIKGRLGGFGYSAKQGMIPYFGVSVINTVKRDMPDDLLGAAWSDPRIIARFAKMLEVAAKELPRDLPYFVIGNEVDSYFEKHPDEVDSYLAFYSKARSLVKLRYPRAKVGMSVTFEGLRKDKSRGVIARAIQASDAAIFTFYPIFDLKPTPPAETPALLDQLVAAAQNKDVLLQEVGYSSGKAIGSSEAMQAEFFRLIIPAIKARPQIKLASIFALYDFDPKVCDMLTNYYGMNSWFVNGASARGFLCTLGVHDASGRPKPAWYVIEKALKQPSGQALKKSQTQAINQPVKQLQIQPTKH